MKKILLFLMIISLSSSSYAWFWNKKKNQKSTVSGTVLIPVENISVYVYREGMDLYGHPYAVSEITGLSGEFNLELPDGSYFFVSRKRIDGEQYGPLKPGDIKSNFIGPIEIKNGKPVTLDFICFIKQGEEKQVSSDLQDKKTGISGTIFDSDGQTIEGVRVHVYTYVQMSERPKYVSLKTGPDGKYLIHLPEGGTYYLAARDKFGGPPKIGDLYGRYDQGTINPSAVIIKEGEIKHSINITVNKVW